MTDVVHPEAPGKARETAFVQSLQRGLAVIRAFDTDHPSLTLSEVARRTGLARAAARRFLLTLVELGYMRVEDRRFQLTPRVLELGHAYLSSLTLPEIALPYMRELHAATGEAVNLSVRRDDEIVYIERTSSGRSLMRVVNIIGARAPLHITAVGKLFLLEDGVDGVKVYAERTGLPAFTKNTIHALPALEKELDRVRRQGFAIDNEEAELGVRCIGAGVRDDTGALVAGLSISSPAERMKAAWSSMVKDTAEKISRAIGYRGQAA